MKIKITETQAKRLNLLKENNEDAIGVLHKNVMRFEPIITKIFNELTNLSVSEILDTNFDNINSVITDIQEKVGLLERQANAYINTQSEDDNWDLENRLTDASYEFKKRLDIVEELNYKLSNLQQYMEENDIMVNILIDCIDYLYDEEQVYYAKDSTRKELEEFVDSMQQKDLEKVRVFFETMPEIKKDFDFHCSKCGYEEKMVVKGLQNFFV